MKSKKLAALLVGATLTFSAGMTLANVDQPTAGDYPRLEHLRATLNLTADQQDKIKKAIDDARPDIQKNMEALKNGRQKLEEIMKAKDFDESAAKDAAKNQGDARTNLILLRIKLHRAVYDVLTPAQKEAFSKMRAEHMRMKEERKKHMKAAMMDSDTMMD